MPIPRFRVRTLIIAVACLCFIALSLWLRRWQPVVFGILLPMIVLPRTLARGGPAEPSSPDERWRARATTIALVLSAGVFALRALWLMLGPQGLIVLAKVLLAAFVIGALPGLVLWANVRASKE